MVLLTFKEVKTVSLEKKNHLYLTGFVSVIVKCILSYIQELIFIVNDLILFSESMNIKHYFKVFDASLLWNYDRPVFLDSV